MIFRKNVPAVYNIKTYGFSKKEMLAIVKFKESEGSFEKFMGFMQSEEGLSEKNFAHPEKTIASVTPDKSDVMFKVFVYDKAGMINFVSGKNEIIEPIYDECIEVSMLYDCTTVNMYSNMQFN